MVDSNYRLGWGSRQPGTNAGHLELFYNEALPVKQLLERDRELSAVDALLERECGLLVIEGGAGHRQNIAARSGLPTGPTCRLPDLPCSRLGIRGRVCVRCSTPVVRAPYRTRRPERTRSRTPSERTARRRCIGRNAPRRGCADCNHEWLRTHGSAVVGARACRAASG